jgi:L-ribulokinase
VRVPESEVTSLGSAIFAFLACGVFQSVEEAQRALCPKFRTVEPDAREAAVYESLFAIYRQLYFALGRPDSEAVGAGGVLPSLRKIAAEVRCA